MTRRWIGLAMVVGIIAFAGADGQSPDIKMIDASSIFLDEVTVCDYYRMEDLYGLQAGQVYQMSCRLKKEAGARSTGAHVGVILETTSLGTNKKNKRFIVEKVGSEVPADGKWHTVRARFTVEAPPGEVLHKGRYGALLASLIVYNKTGGGRVSISDVRGLPKYENYLWLGDKDASLPQVLLIGDSTMMHTYPATVKAFAGKAAIYYLPVNAGHSRGAVQRVRRWVGGHKWDLIYFNSGIHDLTRQNNAGKKGNSEPNRVDLVEYRANLEKIVEVLQQTRAQLLWRSITPLASDVLGRTQDDEARYNAAASALMRQLDVPVHDVTKQHRQPLTKLLRDGVHFSTAGNKLLASALLNHVKENKHLATVR